MTKGQRTVASMLAVAALAIAPRVFAQVGVCCIDTPECIIVTQAECDAQDGIYGGDDTGCGPNPPNPFGACTCGPGAGNCFVANGTAGCEDLQCCGGVCFNDPFCCDFQWDQSCADRTECFPDECFPPLCPNGQGNCFEANVTAGCEEPGCCNLVCSLNPSCCDFEWEQPCVDLAELYCRDFVTCRYDIDGDGVVAVPDLLFLLAAWGECPPPMGSNASESGGGDTLDSPVGVLSDYHLDSGQLPNAGDTATVYEETVQIEGAAWLRLYFGAVELDAGSFVRIRSLLDNEVQELDAAGLAMWSGTSAYFNGDAVGVELVAGPNTTSNSLILDKVASEASGICFVAPGGICGQDDRVPTFEEWTARMMPAGCTASVYNQASCMVTAGHCVTAGEGGGMEPDVVHFRVPASNPDGSLNMPLVADQFCIINSASVNIPGADIEDWAVLIPGTNGPINGDQTIFDRYGEMRPIATAPPANGDPLAIWGYGNDCACIRNQTQQASVGSVGNIFPQLFHHNVDMAHGNSGSAVMRNGEILGIVITREANCENVATRIDLPAFVLARQDLCPCPADFDRDGAVAVPDLLALLAVWGPCPQSHGAPPPTLREVIENAGLVYPDDWNDFRECMTEAPQAEADNCLCWMDHYLGTCTGEICDPDPCPDADPFGGPHIGLQ